jgi:hypothetical protein
MKRFVERSAEMYGETVDEAWERIIGPPRL